MRSIFYLLRKSLKNAVLDTIRHPLKFFLYGMIVVSMSYVAFLGFTADVENLAGGQLSDPRLLSGAYLAILYFISIPILRKGLSSGTSFFTLSDVANIFVAPIPERTVLIYGVGRRLAAMILLAVTFAAYGGILVNLFKLGFGEVFLLLGGIIFMLIMVQLVTLMIFCLASNHRRRTMAIKLFIYFLIFFPIVSALIYVFSRGITVSHIYEAITLPFLDMIPFIGWMHGLIFGIMNGEIIPIAVYGSLTFILMILSIMTLMTTKLDYYEDVLSRAEAHYEFEQAVRECKMSDKVMMGGRDIKLRRQGIKKGRGASAIFHKHLLEGSRRSRFLLFNINTFVLLFAAFVIGFGILQAKPDIERTIIYLATVIILAYIQFFFSASGDWVKELTKPYIYLIPDGAVRKLLMAAATGLIKPFTDGIITFAFLAAFAGGNIIDPIIAALTYGSFGSLYIAANILAQRLVGIDSTGGVFITFYMTMIVLTMLPGIIAGLVVLSVFASSLGFIASTLLCTPVLIWNLLVTAVIFLTCRNLLNNTE